MSVNEYISSEGEIYAPARLTTERVFEDVPLTEIDPLMLENSDAGSKGSCDECWIREKLDASGGCLSRAVLRERWKSETDKSAGQFHTVLGRIKGKAHIREHNGVIKNAAGRGVPAGGNNIV
ncbi:hypothetical protein [Izhakiella capsodis]|uniref:hypothetical protein n=1 Tax=Izhakiella capsodis TaxID=1367852 RepID=UPI00116014EC|nr:hypothetical protein [Izhakiella capsodis]